MTVEHFSKVAKSYRRNRPTYPAELAEALARTAPSRRIALDVGCGNGQFSRLLSPLFDRVIATDASADQIANATIEANIDYRCEPAEKISVANGSTDLVVAAQAAHWFDLSAFFNESKRVLTSDGVLALVAYGIPDIESNAVLDRRFKTFYWDEIHAFWPPQRALVEGGYGDIEFPFNEFDFPGFSIVCDWDLPALLDYIQTWSAMKNMRESGKAEILTEFQKQLAALWTQPEKPERLIWPVAVRVGRL